MAIPELPSAPRPSALPRWARQVLARAGINMRGPVSALRQQVESVGLEVLELGEDWSGVPRERPRYFAAVAAGRGPQAVVSLHWSGHGYTEALAWATAEALRRSRRHPDG